MKTKFIGLEGFNEIESLSTSKKRTNGKRPVELTATQKTVRFIKRASALAFKSVKKGSVKAVAYINNKLSTATKKATQNKKTVSFIDKCYSESRTGNTNSVREAITSIASTNNRKYAHSAPKTGYRTHALLKKRAVLAVVACSIAILLSCVTVASALDMEGSVPTVVTTAKMNDAIISTEPTESIIEENNNGFVYTSSADEAVKAMSDDAYKSITKALLKDNIQTSFAGLYIDGELIGATSEIDALNSALEQILVDYRKDYDEETTTEFANDVVVKPGNFSESDIMTADEIMTLAYGKFSISLSTDIVYTREVKFETIVEYDETQYSSYEKVKTEGKNGTEKVVIRTTFTDGMQTDAVETETIELEKTIDKVVVKGSKDGVKSYNDSSSSSGTSTGSFIWPVPYTHNITSYYEWRWGTMHWGIDISSSGVHGQDIVASDGGTVVHAGDINDGYGYYVIIDHGNGFQTVYAHCDSLAVYEGQYVSQGQTIGYVGSTGWSTGSHLHFEVRQGSNKLNPLNFVS